MCFVVFCMLFSAVRTCSYVLDDKTSWFPDGDPSLYEVRPSRSSHIAAPPAARRALTPALPAARASR